VLTDQTTPPVSVAEAFAECRRFALRQGENFTVASWLLPRRLRPHMYSLYAYCRRVDDLGDEAAGDRLELLHGWEGELRRCFEGSASAPTFVALGETVREFGMPMEPFLRLIEANRQDQRVKRYGTFDELLDYCTYSANPVGHMVLYLFGYRDAERRRLADATCTALQLANFWRDVSVDLSKGRVYIPLEEMERFGYSEEDLVAGRCNDAFRRLMAFQVLRTRQFFADGITLIGLVSPRLRYDLKLFTLGGLSVLSAIERAGYDVLTQRPGISKTRKLWLGMRALVPIRVGAAGR
jgi:squalene synthase HpnC